ncbi:hypothetical protein B840_10870 [Corynebacterium marinum DSM 44953]|uniref:Uncharacterized protein n=1 Tax=Corynebacterium marinum DSM 44953 TaxID=1224162 RepID=A0A0B6TYF7_9CORY|nr:hypothetical protein B840_10870 [Corynebacterium marinum DSM 44953]
MGTAIPMGSPPAAMPTVIEVVVVEDWVSTVARTPIMRPMKGFSANWNNCSARPPEAVRKPEPMAPTAVMSTPTARTTTVQSTAVFVAPLSRRKPSG